ncbi:MAG TPA: SDR family oxidoreductase [Allosphingosinicella sp.]
MPNTILITGASSGFGEATARLFAERGWNVAATMRRPEAGAALARLDNVLVTRLDVEDQPSIEAAVAETIERFGRIDAVVNNAGFGLMGIFEATPWAKIREQFEVNLFGAMAVIRAVLPHLRANRSGVIANVSSGAGGFALPLISLYTSSKFALEGFSESLAYELADLGVRVKIVEPGGVTSTGFTARSGEEASLVGGLSDYRPFLDGAGAIFQGLVKARAGATSEEVAEVIHRAVTDGTDQLRYIATEDIKPMLAMRRETSEAEYIAYMRERFAPKIG